MGNLYTQLLLIITLGCVSACTPENKDVNKMELYNNVNNSRKRKQSPEEQERMKKLADGSIEAMTGQDSEEYRAKRQQQNGMPKFPQEQPAAEAPTEENALEKFMGKVKKKLGMDGPSWEDKVGQAFKRADKRSK